MSSEYIQDQLDRLNLQAAIKIQLSDSDGHKTNHLTLTIEIARAILEIAEINSKRGAE